MGAMARRVIRVGGVHEPFNLPWIRAFDADAFADLGLEVTFEEFAGGTGALVEALENGTIDLATLLTEGAVTAIGRGRAVRIHSGFTTTPLTWGIHVAAESDATEVADLVEARFAISRHGSGSELMAYVLADQLGWTLDDDRFVTVGGVDGAIEALPEGRAEVFLWERYVTSPLVEQGVFRRVGDLPTPWPAFVTAGRRDLLTTDRPLVDDLVARVLAHAAALAADRDGTAAAIVDRYGMSADDTASWLAQVGWPDRPAIEAAVLEPVVEAMVDLGRIDQAVSFDDLLR